MSGDGSDSYESSGSTTTTTTVSGVSYSTYYTYAQIAVPTFTLTAPIYQGGDHSFSSTTTGGSFLRLGSSPVTVSGSSGNYKMGTATDAPSTSGFANSLLLAALVGNMDSSNTTTTTTKALVDVETADSLTIGHDGLIETDPYKGDTNYLLGFADDTRSAKPSDTSGSTTDKTDLYVDGAKVSNTVENRKAESSRLLSKGGWWDHSDGNRISTTAGDKIEVIQGNYKLVVLGRRDPKTITDGADITDSSGGHQASKTYEYTTVDGVGMWAVRDISSSKYSYKETHGYDMSLFTGTKQVKVVGEDPTDPAGSGSTSVVSGKDPVIISRTWAEYTESYTGSPEKYVPKTISKAYVDEAYSYSYGTLSYKFVEATNIQSFTFATKTNVSVSAYPVNVSVGTYAVNVSTAVCAVIDVSMKSSPFAFSFSGVRGSVELKMGSTTSFNYVTTYAYIDAKTVKMWEQNVVLEKEEVAEQEVKIVESKTEVAADATAVQGNSTKVNAFGAWLAGEISMM